MYTPQVLIVDDESMWCDDLLKYLPQIAKKKTPFLASTHNQALKFIKTEVIDLAILNVVLDMSDKDAIFINKWIEVLDRIKEKNIGVLIISADNYPGRIEQTELMRIAFRQYHVIDFLPKGKFAEEKKL